MAWKVREWAEKLNGREYGFELSKKEIEELKKDGIVVIYGASDDLMEIRGAMDDEVDCYNGGKFYWDQGSEEWKELGKGEATDYSGIVVNWYKEGFSWTYEMLRESVVYENFIIKEDGVNYCRGMVFEYKDFIHS